MPTRTASIIGGGIGGMTAGLALMRRGWRVRIYEQAPTLREVGAGISISPGAGAGLASLGLETALLRASLPVARLAFVHFRTGEVLSSSTEPATSTAPICRRCSSMRFAGSIRMRSCSADD